MIISLSVSRDDYFGCPAVTEACVLIIEMCISVDVNCLVVKSIAVRKLY